MRKFIAAGAAAGALVGAGVTVAVTAEDEGEKNSPRHTAYSFVHAIKHGNFGRACHYMSQWYVEKESGSYADCPAAFRTDGLDTLRIVPGTEMVSEDGQTYRYAISFTDTECDWITGACRKVDYRNQLTVVKTKYGNWRVAKIVYLRTL